MIRHIAVFRFKPEFDEQARRDWIAMIEALPQHIDGITSLTIGFDVVGGPFSYDIGLVVDFVNREAMAAYNVHPEHQKVLDVSGPVKEHLAVVDLEI